MKSDEKGQRREATFCLQSYGPALIGSGLQFTMFSDRGRERGGEEMGCILQPDGLRSALKEDLAC